MQYKKNLKCQMLTIGQEFRLVKVTTPLHGMGESNKREANPENNRFEGINLLPTRERAANEELLRNLLVVIDHIPT